MDMQTDDYLGLFPNILFLGETGKWVWPWQTPCYALRGDWLGYNHVTECYIVKDAKEYWIK